MSAALSSLVTTDLGYPEGPVAFPDGSLIVTELARSRGCVTRVATDGSHRRLAVTGRPNGLAYSRDDTLWVAESLDPALLRLSLDGKVDWIADRIAGEPLLWPNDLCFGPDGAIYLTDSGTLVTDFMDGDVPRQGWEAVPLDGKVFRLDRASGEGAVLDRGLSFANGIAFGPDRMLHVTETMSGNVYRYRPGPPWRRELFGNVLDPDWQGSGFRGPDGMAFDSTGRLYIAVFGQGDVTTLDRDGHVARRHDLRGSAPTNCAFATDGTASLFVVEDEHGAIERLELGVGGLELWS
ncbi:MAG: SMP-30/gluconolactonase/LRE family protein [Thermoleophilaceae bacterium]